MRCASKLPLTTLAATMLAVSALVWGADLVHPNIKPGLWEVTNTPQVSGQMTIPDDQLAKMTPAQRAQMEAVMQAYQANSAKPQVHKECMTPEKIAKGFDIERGDESQCKRKVVSSSPNELTMHDECTKPDQTTVSDVHFEIKGGTQMSGKINIVMTSKGKTMTVNNVLQGKWLGADCGAVKDSELEK